MFRLACTLRGDGVPQVWAERFVLGAAEKCGPPFPADEARKKVRASYDKFPAGTSDGEVPVQTAEDFLARTFPEKEPLVEGLVHKRDLVAFGARRRVGKTTFVSNLAIAGAAGEHEFLGYATPNPFRSLLFMVEDDGGEFQEKFKVMVGDRDLGGRLAIMTRDDFRDQHLRIFIRDNDFREVVKAQVQEHDPDLIVL